MRENRGNITEKEKSGIVLRKRILLATAILIFLVGLASATSPFPMSLTTNTLYQNTNTTPLSIYSITHSAQLSAYLGNSSSNMLEVTYEDGGSVTVSTIVYSLAGYNMSSYMLVQPGEYYKFNFTSANFIGQYSPSSSSGSQNTLFLYMPSSAISQYSNAAIILFAVGIMLSIFLWLNVLEVVPILKRARGTFVGGISYFIIAFAAVILLIFAGFYGASLNTPAYHFIAPGTGNVIVNTTTTTQTPLIRIQIIGAIIILFSIVDGVIGGLSMFAFVLFVRKKRKEAREKKGNN